MRESLLRRTLVLVVVVGTLVLTAGPALALTTAPDRTWRVNGKGFALAQSGNTIFVGGTFGKVVSPDGTQKLDAKALAAFDMTTGAWVPTFTPSVTNTIATGAAAVRALAVSNDGSILYVGGKFDTVDGQPRQNFAAVDTASGALIDTINVSVSNVVNAIMVGPDLVYFGGGFNRVNAKPRLKLAAIAPDGTLSTAWHPSANDVIRSFALSSDGNTIFIGGKYTTMNGQPRASVSRVSPVDGTLDPWAIPAGVIDAGNPAWTLLATPTRLYGGFGNGPNYLASFRLDNGSTGSQVWRTNFVGNVQGLSMHPNGTRLFVGGHFGTAVLQQTACGIPLRGLVMVDPTNGAIDCSWIPQIEPHGSNYTAAWTLLGTPTQLWVAGFFTSISGVTQQGFARYTL
jgi:Domain of unknown function (DUF5122) beta-propeller